MTAKRARRLRIDGELTVATAAEHHQRLRAALATGAAVEVNLAGVTELDTAGLQVLLHARREAVRLHRTLTYRDRSGAVDDVLTFTHLDEALDGVRAVAQPEA